MTLREVTRAVISLVETASSCPVVVSEDASLGTIGLHGLRAPRTEFTRLLLTLQRFSEPDYLIC
jgi:hypothetical protein